MSRILRNKYKTMLEKINTELEGSPFRKQQDFLLFNEAEYQAVRDAMRLSGLSKSRTIGIGCWLLKEKIEKNKAKSDGEES